MEEFCRIRKPNLKTKKIFLIMKSEFETLCPSLKEIKVCEQQIKKLEKNWYNNTTQEEFFEARKHMRIFKQVMKEHAALLVEQLAHDLDTDAEYYKQYATSPNQKMMRDYILAEDKKIKPYL